MGFDLEGMLVIGISSSALFDLSISDSIFREEGTVKYREHQEANIDQHLPRGVAFPFIRRLLSLNNLSGTKPLVEVVVMSRNSPETGLRVMRSVAHYGLDITRSIFTEGASPYPYMPALNMSLFLSANEEDVKHAVDSGFPAGQVLPCEAEEDASDPELRVAFDFDGVLANDESERVYKEEGLDGYLRYEAQHSHEPLDPGPLSPLLQAINRIQRIEETAFAEDQSYVKRVQVSLVTSRGAPTHERAVETLQHWGTTVNGAFFLGGLDKNKILDILNPHIFFDDQRAHVDLSARSVPSVHVPFGVRNHEDVPPQ